MRLGCRSIIKPIVSLSGVSSVVVLITMVGVFVVTPFGGVTAGRVRIGTDTVVLSIKNGFK